MESIKSLPENIVLSYLWIRFQVRFNAIALKCVNYLVEAIIIIHGWISALYQYRIDIFTLWEYRVFPTDP